MYVYCIMFQYIVIVINKLNGTLESAGESCYQYLNPGHRGLIVRQLYGQFYTYTVLGN